MNSDASGKACQQSAFVRVDESSSEVVDISDLIRLFEVMFRGLAIFLCFDSPDTNADGPTDMSDVIVLLSNQILDGKPSPPLPDPTARLDPTFDDLLRCHGSLTCTSV